MSRRDRRQQPEPSAQPPTVAEVPRAAPETPLAGAPEGGAGLAPTLPPEPAYRARVAIRARPLGDWERGDTVPSRAALALLADGFALGRELELVEG